MNEILPVTYKIYHSFDNGFKIRGVFLDISKALDEGWPKGLTMNFQITRKYLEIFIVNKVKAKSYH